MTGVWTDGVAVVTGGSSGIGFALAQRLAREGMDIAIAATNEAKLTKAAESLRQSSGREVATVVCDVSDRTQVRALADGVRARFGRVDMLCANAGGTTLGAYLDHASADWDWAIDVNLRGVTHCIEAFYPDMVSRRSGTILLTASHVALFPDWIVGHGPYVPAKSAVVALALALRAEAAEHGVQVSALLPGGTETTLTETARRVPPDRGGFAVREGFPQPSTPLLSLMSSDEVAARAVSGLRADAPLIVTHPGLRPLVEEYFSRVLAAYDSAEAWRPEEG